jgi:hypothetical protein
MEYGLNRPFTIAIGLAVVAIAFGIFLVRGIAAREEPRAPSDLTEVTDPVEIRKMLEMSHLGILTSSNYLGQRIYTVTATLRNISTTPVRLVDVKMTFLDSDKKPIHDEVHPAFEFKQRALQPGTEYRFEIPFENPPRAWNYIVPNTEPVRVAY